MLVGCSFLPIQSDTDFYGLIIGINYDTNPSINNLFFCEADATSIQSSLLDEKIGNWKTEELNVLLGEEATKDAILNGLSGLRDIINKADEKDLILVYFSGHGASIPDVDGDEADGYDEVLVPVDAQTDMFENIIASTIISDDDLGNMFSSCKTEKGIFIIDACHSGGVINKSLAGTNIRVKSIDSINQKSSGGSGDLTITNFPVMTACSQNEVSYEDPTLWQGHGVFSYFLLEGFQNLKADRNKDNFITVKELFNYAENHTETYTSMHPFMNTQHPAMRFPMDFIDILITR